MGRLCVGVSRTHLCLCEHPAGIASGGAGLHLGSLSLLLRQLTGPGELLGSASAPAAPFAAGGMGGTSLQLWGDWVSGLETPPEG